MGTANRILLLAAIALAGCTGPVPGEVGDRPTRPALTVQGCLERGGEVVGDIGDGRIHRPDYRCADGAPPIGTIAYPRGAAMPIEGAVCCRTTVPD